jgi:hypothetical protein
MKSNFKVFSLAVNEKENKSSGIDIGTDRDYLLSFTIQ